MTMREYIDVLVPRGGADLIKTTIEKSRIPVIETGTGNCHIYVEEDADLEKATPIVINAKVQRPGVCNAAEKLLVNSKIAKTYLPSVIAELRKNGVEVRGDEATQKIVSDVKAATEQDWYTEYLDLIIGVKVVDSLDEAIAHINKYGTHHSDSIITQDFSKATQFLKEVDSAAVYWNASTTIHRRQPIRVRRRNRHKHPETACTRPHERPAPNNDEVCCFGRWANPQISEKSTSFFGYFLKHSP